MVLRPATLADVPALARLGRDSFTAAFGHLYDPADLAAFLDTAHDETKVAREIAGADQLHCLADEDELLAGFAKLDLASPYAGYSEARRPIALSQLYTAPDSTGRGIGAALMDWVLAEARTRNADAIQLSVWSENFGAQRFYQRYGFAKIADIDFWVGTHRDDEFLYEKHL